MTISSGTISVFIGQIAGDEDDGSIFTQGAREGQGEAGQERGADHGENHTAENLPAGGAQARRGFFEFQVGVFENGLDAADYEGESDEGEGDDDAERGEGDFDAERNQETPQPAVFGVEAGEGDAGDCCRQREG